MFFYYLAYSAFQFYHFRLYFSSLSFCKIIIVALWQLFRQLQMITAHFLYAHMTAIFFSTLVGLLEFFFTQMTATRQRICKLITKNLEKRTKTLLHYHSIRKKLMADFSLFTAINNTYGVFFLSSVVVFLPDKRFNGSMGFDWRSEKKRFSADASRQSITAHFCFSLVPHKMFFANSPQLSSVVVTKRVFSFKFKKY